MQVDTLVQLQLGPKVMQESQKNLKHHTKMARTLVVRLGPWSLPSPLFSFHTTQPLVMAAHELPIIVILNLVRLSSRVLPAAGPIWSRCLRP